MSTGNRKQTDRQTDLVPEVAPPEVSHLKTRLVDLLIAIRNFRALYENSEIRPPSTTDKRVDVRDATIFLSLHEQGGGNERSDWPGECHVTLSSP